MLSSLSSATLHGITAIPVTVEIYAQKGVPQTVIVGLPDTVVKESINRIHAAIKNAGFALPPRKVTINLAPANITKEGPLLDLAISIGILQSTQQLAETPGDLFVGELSLSGNIKPIQGILCICEMAKQQQYRRIYMPLENCSEAALLSPLPIIGVKSLQELTTAITKNQAPMALTPPTFTPKTKTPTFEDVKGQALAKRALEIAAIGHHNVLMIGPPGSGKTMLARRFPSLLKPLTISEAIENSKLNSILPQDIAFKSVSSQRPFRSPHHSISYAGMAGGGTKPKPGEISLAHNGVLFLDELPEYSKQVLETLREPLESKEITLSRANFSITYPASFILIAAMNPCPCGFYMDAQKACSCRPHTINRYWKKISGPILDRIDIIIDVPRLTQSDYIQSPPSSSSPKPATYESLSPIRSFILKRRQNTVNAQLTPKELATYCQLNNASQLFLSEQVANGTLTGRSHDKVIKVARSIADMELSPTIEMHHILESLQYRKQTYKT